MAGPEPALQKSSSNRRSATMGRLSTIQGSTPSRRTSAAAHGDVGDDPALRQNAGGGQRFLISSSSDLIPLPLAIFCKAANLALKAGVEEKGVLACLLHDIAMVGLIGVTMAIGAPNSSRLMSMRKSPLPCAITSLRFFLILPPAMNIRRLYRHFGKDYKPEPYIYATNDMRSPQMVWHGGMITLNDLYAFDPNTTVDLEVFTDIVGRHFRQPKEGLV